MPTRNYLIKESSGAQMLTATKLTKCRACESEELVKVVELGVQNLTGVFPLINEPDPMSGPLNLIFCSNCTLVQLEHSFPSDLMYGDNYGYRSGLNSTMVHHLEKKSKSILRKFKIDKKATVIDIGSNDGTLLNSLLGKIENLVGIDPSASKFLEYYDSSITVIPEFFSAEAIKSLGLTADLVFSIAMFYDLDNPVKFAKEVSEILSDNGIWHLEQSYILTMLETTSFDTICHEHLEYYSLSSLQYIFDKANLKIIDVELNDVNGGSISVTVAKKNSIHVPTSMVAWLESYEKSIFNNPIENLIEFNNKIKVFKENLINLLRLLKKENKIIYGLGASTKGNVLLQYCGIGPELLTKVIDVNPFKFGRKTPGTSIEIVSEEVFKSEKIDYCLVLPWHFKNNLLTRSAEFLESGGKIIFPLPNITIY